MKIRTNYWQKPIPDRRFDWTATEEDYEPPMPIGYGRTEDEAVADLKEKVSECEQSAG